MYKKKFVKKMVGGILLTAIISVQLAGCTDSKSGETGEEAKSTTSTASESKEVVKEEISIWCGGPGPQLKQNAAYKDVSESPFHVGLQDKTGINVDWQFPTEGEDSDQAYNLLLTNDTLPDMIFHYFTVGDAETLMEDGVIYDLTEYLPEYAPDYWAYLQAEGNEELDKDMKTEDGKYYGFGSFKEGEFNLTYTGPVVRKDWLEENNLEEPVTLDDWDNVLRVFKEKYNATLGFYKERMDPGFASGNDAYASFMAKMYIDDNGKVQLAQTAPEWKEHMSILAGWYEDGLIDKDVATLDDAGLRTKVLNNEIGASYTAISQISNWQKDAADQGNGAEWIGVENPRISEGTATNMIHSTGSRYYNYCAVVTTSCPEDRLKTVLEWLNYGYTEEGIQYWNYGAEGESYTLDSQGLEQWTDIVKNDASGLSDALSKYTGVHGTGLSIQTEHFVKIKNDENAVEAVDKWIDNTEAYEHILPNGLALSPEENTEYTDKWAAIKTRVDEMALKYFIGEESLDNFDAFVAELDSMGLQEVLRIQQDAYDRYLTR